MPYRSFFWIGLAALIFGGCATTPYTNRKQLMMVSEDEETQMGAKAFQDEVLSKSKISKDPEANALVQRVGHRIAQAANKPNYQWQFIVIDDSKTVNAFCLPGGKVAVYMGILPITKDENGLAVVLSHEVSHALARHGAERISGQEAAGFVLGVALNGQSEVTQSVVAQAYGLGVVLPFSRSQESEADHIGLILMAKSGYDPRGAVDFWQRMSQAMGGKAPPAFLSDHPSDQQRIQKIKEELPEALGYYKP